MSLCGREGLFLVCFLVVSFVWFSTPTSVTRDKYIQSPTDISGNCPLVQSFAYIHRYNYRMLSFKIMN